MSEKNRKEETKDVSSMPDVEGKVKGKEIPAGPAGFDMASIETVTKSNDGVWCTLLDPSTYEESSVRVKLLGYDSDLYVKWNAQEQAKLKTKMLQAVADSRKHKKIDAEGLEVPDDAEALSQLVIDWENVIWEGKPLACTHENILKVLTKVPAIRTQVKNFVEDRANFFAKDLTNS